jgi:hypothetical protein
MSYIGQSSALYDPTRTTPTTVQLFSGNGSTTQFTLQYPVTNSADIEVIVENVIQQPDYAYFGLGNSLTFTSAPPSGTNNIYVRFGKITGLTGSVPDGSITSNKLATNIRLLATDQYIGDGVTLQFNLSDYPADANSLIVTVNGITESAPTNYTIANNTLTFTSAPASGSKIVIRNMGFRTTQTLYALPSGTPIVQPIITGGTVNNTNVSNSIIINPTINGGTANNITIANSTFSGGLSGSNITANTISNTSFQTGSVENYMNSQGLNLGMRNRIINGAMMIDQRNVGGSITITPTGGGQYTVDRWFGQASQSSKFSVQQNAGSVTPPIGFSNYCGVTSLSAYSVTSGDYFSIRQQIEGYNIADLAFGTANAKSITVSFWVYSSLTGTFGGSAQSVFASGSTRTYPFTFSIASANTWTYITVTIPGDTGGSGVWATGNGVGLSLAFGLGVGSTYSASAGSWISGNYISTTGATSVVGTNGATFYITGVQLEKGSVATPFENRLYGAELALCQRYAVKFGGGSTNDAFGTGFSAGTTYYIQVPFPVTMRATPTLTVYGSYADINTTTVGIAAPASSTPSVVGTGITSTVLSIPSSTSVTAGYAMYSRVVSASTLLLFASEL